MDVTCTWVNETEEKWYMDFVPKELFDAYRNDPKLFLYGIAAGSTAVGAALVHILGAQAFLRYVYVAPEYRRMGYCDACIAQLGYDLWEMGAQMLAARYVPQEQETLHGRLDAHGAEFFPTGGGAFAFTLADAKKSESLAGSAKGVEALSTCTNTELLRLSGRLKKKRADLVALPIEASDYEADCSCVYKTGGEISAVLLVKQEGGAFDIPFVYSDAGSPAVFLLLMRFALAQAGKRLSDETVCTLRTLDGAMTRLVEKVLGKKAEAEVEARLGFADYAEDHGRFVESLMLFPIAAEDEAALFGEA